MPALFYEFCGSCIIFYAFNLGSEDPFVRAVAYIIGYIIAYNVSGGHFNPATSLAVFLTEKKYYEHKFYFIAVMIV